MTRFSRRYVDVQGRRVHYRRVGEGPPLVMLHGSPGDSEMLAHEMAATAGDFTCFALDTPGFGGSDALPGDQLSVADLAGATAAAMTALGLPRCRVYGTHTGAAIAIELGVGWPRQVSGLVLEGLPLFTQAEMDDFFQGYFAPMVADPLGGHLTSTWMRFRDQFIWFPWLSRSMSRLNPVARPTAEEIQPWVEMFYRSCKTYAPAYRAACFYGQAGYRAAEALLTPAIYMASAEDMLHPHLDRLPPLKPSQRIERLPYDPGAKYQTLRRFAQGLPGGGSTPPDAQAAVPPAGRDPGLQFVDTPNGQVLVRCYGESGNPAVILLHDAPGAGLALESLARRLAETSYVILPDLPGNGDSEAPSPDHSVLEAGATAVSAIADALLLKRFALAAIGCGGAVAATFAERHDPRLVALLLEGAPHPDEATAEAIAPELALSPEGAHWVRAWLIIRDGQIYHPWFDGRIAAQRRTQGVFDADWLHDQTVALMRGRKSYHRLPREAYRFDSAAALSKATVPVHLAETGGLGALVERTFEVSRPED